MPPENVIRNLAAAADAVRQTRSDLFLGAGNYWNDPSDSRYQRRLALGRISGMLLGSGRQPQSAVYAWIGENVARFGPELVLTGERISQLPQHLGIGFARLWARCRGNVNQRLGLEFMDTVNAARSGRRRGVGNCDEHACLCFLYLFEHPSRPRPLEILTAPNHAFCAIGRELAEEPQDWGNEVVIVDAYYNEWYWLENGNVRPRQRGAEHSKCRITN